MSDIAKLESIMNDLTRRSQAFHNADFVCIGYHYEGNWWARTAYAFTTSSVAANPFDALAGLEQHIRRAEDNWNAEAAE